MKKVKILINGYGRIGRVLHRIMLQSNDVQIEVAAINSRSDAASHAHLLKYDSTYGIIKEKVSFGKDWLKINGHKIKVFVDKSPGEIDLKKEDVKIVAECTGKFKDRESCEKQLEAGAKKVVISAPGKDEDVCLVLGVNHRDYNPRKHKIISNASCTTNALALTIKVLQDNFGVRCGQMTTIHALTRSQNMLDASHSKNMRIARCAIDSFIPSSTGASKAIGQIFPELDGCFNAISVRIPFATVSLVDLVAQLNKKTSTEEVNQAFIKASKANLKGLLGFTTDPLVSIDFKGECRTTVIDGLSTNVLEGRIAKILSWYDNEWGYTCRFYDLLKMVSQGL
jgi:glyceraldehyde 3-phosphate dehydrogenase